jgi:hypothetical protein
MKGNKEYSVKEYECRFEHHNEKYPRNSDARFITKRLWV